jgi:hypothetical protein
MTITNKSPCTLTLNTHGGAVIDFGWVTIHSCLGGWAFSLAIEGHKQRESLSDNIATAYVVATKTFCAKFSQSQDGESHSEQQCDVVDQW